MPHQWYCSCTIAHPRPVTNGGAEGGEGQRGGGRGGLQGGRGFLRKVEGIVLHPCAHQHRAEGVLSTLVHAGTGEQSLLLCASTRCEVEVPSPVHISAVRRGSKRGGGGQARGSGAPPRRSSAQGGGIGSPPWALLH